jgi:transcriptional regulator with XRE-family HTH domain
MPTTFNIITGHRLRDVREYRKQARSELAARLDAAVHIIAKLESGEHTITARRRQVLARALRVDPKALLLMPGAPVKELRSRRAPRIFGTGCSERSTSARRRSSTRHWIIDSCCATARSSCRANGSVGAVSPRHALRTRAAL